MHGHYRIADDLMRFVCGCGYVDHELPADATSGRRKEWEKLQKLIGAKEPGV